MSKKILIIDDEEGIRESLKLILGDHYDLILTENGPQGLEILKNSGEIALIFLDIKMPKVHGLDILKKIKTDFPQIPVIIITGYKSFETAASAANLGAQGYIVKPFKSKEILEAAQKHLG